MVHLWNVKPGYQAEIDDRAWGSPAEQLALKGYFDFTPLVQSAQRLGAPYLCVKCHGTENWTNAKDILRVIQDSTKDSEPGQ
jgi:hypothetical protein